MLAPACCEAMCRPPVTLVYSTREQNHPACCGSEMAEHDVSSLAGPRPGEHYHKWGFRPSVKQHHILRGRKKATRTERRKGVLQGPTLDLHQGASVPENVAGVHLHRPGEVCDRMRLAFAHKRAIVPENAAGAYLCAYCAAELCQDLVLSREQLGRCRLEQVRILLEGRFDLLRREIDRQTAANVNARDLSHTHTHTHTGKQNRIIRRVVCGM